MAIIKADAARNLVSAFSGAQGAKLQANDSIKFDAKEIQLVLNQAGCDSLRVYFAQNANDAAGKPSVVLVGVDSGDKNITTNNILVEYGTHCTVAI